MARIYKKNNAIHTQYQKNIENIPKNIISGIFISVILFLVLLIGDYVGLEEFQSPIVLLASPFPILVGIAISIKANNDNIRLQKFIEDEENFARIIADLPEGYMGFQNYEIVYNRKTIKINMIVVGPTGVFIILVKNYGGNIYGNIDDASWNTKKMNSDGKMEIQRIGNPIYQAKLFAEELNDYFEQNGIAVNSKAILYFSNPNGILHIDDKDEEVKFYSRFKHEELEINSSILDGEEIFSNEDIYKISELLRE